LTLNKPHLVRSLGLIGAISVNVGNTIGTGVFLKARIMTCNVGDPLLVIGAWVLGGLLALAGALTYSELAAMIPKAGGEYVFLREAYGRAWGFIYGWTIFFVARTGAEAALAIGGAIFINVLTGGALEGIYFSIHVFGHPIPFGKLQLVAVASIALMTLLNCASVSFGGGTASALTAIKISILLALGGAAFFFGHGDWSHFASSGAAGLCEAVSPSSRGGLAGFGAAMLGALWAYDGWNNLTPLSGEVKNPHRNLPLAFIVGMFIVAGLYIFVNSAYFYVLPPVQIANVPLTSSVATAVASSFLGSSAGKLIALALLVSSLGALHSSILSNSRVPFAMAQDGLFFRKLAAVSPRTRVPLNAVVAQGAWASVLALSGSYDVLTDYVIFASWLLYGLTAATVFVFRRRIPDSERAYRAWGYPAVPALFLLVTAWLLVNTLITSPGSSLTGLGLMAMGIPFYWYWSRTNSTKSTR